MNLMSSKAPPKKTHTHKKNHYSKIIKTKQHDKFVLFVTQQQEKSKTIDPSEFKKQLK